MFPHHHLERQDPNCPNVSGRPTIGTLGILRGQILQSAHNLLVFKSPFAAPVG